MNTTYTFTSRPFLFLAIGLLALLFAFQVRAQAPESVNYQAVVRDAQGVVLMNQAVAFRLNIREGSATGTVVYAETHSLTTNSFGLANLQLGSGTATSGTFNSIDWGGDSHFIEVELDENGGTNYQVMGTQQLISVPYALHAKTVEIDQVDDADADPANEIQLLTKTGNTVSLSNGGGTITDEVDDADADPANEIQMISKTGNIISLSNGGGSLTDEVDDADADPANEIQALTISSDTIYLSNGGFVTLPADQINDADADPANEIQALTISGDTIYLSNGGFVTLPADQVNDADADPANEIQALSISGDTIYLSNGGFVTLPADQINDADADPANEIQALSISGDTIYLSNGGFVTLPADQVNDADADSTNEIQALSISGDTIYLSNGGFVTLPADQINDADADPTNEIQILSISNDTVYLSGGGFVQLPADQVNDADADSTNELQTLTKSGNIVTLSQGGGTFTDEVDDLDWTLNGNDQYSAVSGNVGIGTSNLPSKLSVNGNISVVDTNGQQFIQLKRITSATSSRLDLRNVNDKLNVSLTSVTGQINHGFIAVYNEDNDQRFGAAMSNTSPSGLHWTYGNNGSLNSYGTFLTGHPNFGYFYVCNSTSTNKAGIYVDASGDGVVYGDVKNFRMDHPTQEGKEIWYASLEGPEAAAYVRGTGQLVNGSAQIQFEDHFQQVANPSTMTVIITPLDGSSKGLAVITKTQDGFEVTELMNGSGNYAFDWEVKCVRQGYEDFRVIRDASEMQAGGLDAEGRPPVGAK